MTMGRRQFLAAAATVAVAGCSGDGGQANPTESGDGSTEETATGTQTPGDPSAVPTAADRLPLPMAPEELRNQAQSGGPPKDGIPSIDDPEFADATSVDFLDPGDPVFGVVREDVVKAYPQKILVWHEIVNDHLAGTPVSVTYCPLTGTVQGFERGETTFGVSGRLINNNLVMYDRATEAWWPQILATSIPGPWNADPAIRSLQEFRLVWTTWERWRQHNPGTQVLTTNTGSAKNYGRDPYGGYNPPTGHYANDRLPFPALDWDDRYSAKTVVMGARTPDGAVAFLKDAVRQQRLVPGKLAGTALLAVHDGRYDTAYVYLNPNEDSFEFEDGAVVGPDGTEHAPDALPLERIHTFDAMWFAWSGYYPETTVYG
ncbi:DUF3179 domain-containing protein [Halobacteriales archaeon Cl-PHB]